MNEYEKEAQKFLKDTESKLTITKYPENLEPEASWSPHGYAYKVTLQNFRGKHVFDFWDSYNNRIERKRPKAYDVLACLASESHYSDYTVDEVAEEFGHEKPSVAIRIHKALQDTSRALESMYSSDQLKQLQEIQ